jgi:hypothetical protein
MPAVREKAIEELVNPDQNFGFIIAFSMKRYCQGFLFFL